jgi:hypothetical protein
MIAHSMRAVQHPITWVSEITVLEAAFGRLA